MHGGLPDTTSASAAVRASAQTVPSGCSTVWTGACTAHCCACHVTFATVGLFDAHRSIAGVYGSCRDPATLTYQVGQRAGERVMFWRDGLWQAPEMTDEE